MPKKIVSVILPALNEEETIALVIEEIPRMRIERKGHELEILVVDNNSTDETGKIAEALGARVVVETQPGKGRAMRTGFKESRGDFIFMLDADYTYPATYLPPMLDLLELGWDVVLGSRIRGYREPGAMSRLNLLGNHMLALLATVLFRKRVSDVCSGSWGFRREVVEQLDLEGAVGFELEAKMFIEVARRGYRIGEVPIYYRKRPNKPNLNSLRDGFRIARTLVRKRVR
jgi:dolichol-phosphate mannosyltransferase